MNDDLKERLRHTTQQMATTCSVDMALWNYHSNACLLAADRIETLEAEVERLKEALTPSADTKADFMGEFWFTVPVVNEDGDEVCQKHYVPWDTVKQIMKAIAARAALGEKGEG